MNAFEYIQNNLVAKIKPSRNRGVGLFALKDIPKGFKLFEKWEGETGIYEIKEYEYKKLSEDVITHINDIFMLSENYTKDKCIYVELVHNCHWIFTNPYYFINSGFYDNSFNIDKDSFTTLRFIKKGEEILSNYKRYDKFSPKIF